MYFFWISLKANKKKIVERLVLHISSHRITDKSEKKHGDSKPALTRNLELITLECQSGPGAWSIISLEGFFYPNIQRQLLFLL